jgi:pimeloyl-ACP methyl ester carboxylesterase
MLYVDIPTRSEFNALRAVRSDAAFEIYRAFPEDETFNAAQTAPNSVPLVVAVGEESFFNGFLDTFVDGYRAKGMTRVEGARIPGAGHFVVADNPEAVAELIEESAGN